MIDKNSFIDFLNHHFESKRIDVQHFDSGCSMVDIFLDERDMICVQIEPSLIGVSMIENYPDAFDLSTIPDNVFYTNADAASFILSRGS